MSRMTSAGLAGLPGDDARRGVWRKCRGWRNRRRPGQNEVPCRPGKRSGSDAVLVNKPAESVNSLYTAYAVEPMVGGVGDGHLVDKEKNIEPTKRDGADVEEIAGNGATGLGFQELRPRWASGPAGPVPGRDGGGAYGPRSPTPSPRACGTRPRCAGSPIGGSHGPASGRGRGLPLPESWGRDGRASGTSTTGRRGPGAITAAWPA